MTKRNHVSAAALAACLAVVPLAGCTQQSPPPEDYEAQRAKIDEYRQRAGSRKPFERVPEGEEGPGEQVVADVPRVLLDAIAADAAGRQGISESRVTVISAYRVEWPDGSLGCPVPGEVYTQAIVPGYQVQVSAAGKVLDYRSDLGGRFFVCGPERLRQAGPAQ